MKNSKHVQVSWFQDLSFPVLVQHVQVQACIRHLIHVVFFGLEIIIKQSKKRNIYWALSNIIPHYYFVIRLKIVFFERYLLSIIWYFHSLKYHVLNILDLMFIRNQTEIIVHQEMFHFKWSEMYSIRQREKKHMFRKRKRIENSKCSNMIYNVLTVALQNLNKKFQTKWTGNISSINSFNR